MAVNASRNFAKLLVGQSCIRDGATSSYLTFTQTSSSSARLFQSSSASSNASLIKLPSLADTGVKFNSARWAGPEQAESLSIFDTKGAFTTLSSPVPPEAMTAGMRALSDRVARAQQQQATVAGFQLFPDLTPGRAFMWGTIVSVWLVCTGTVLSARALGINSVKEVPEKMKQHLSPIKEWSREHLGAVSASFATTDHPEVLQDAHTFASAVKRNLSKGVRRPTYKAAESEMAC